jgi:hypothetical protein
VGYLAFSPTPNADRMRQALVPAGSLLLTLLLPAALPAQSVVWLRGAVGVEQAAQHNPGESAYTYSGFGPTVLLGVGRETPASALGLTLDLGLASLRSDVTGERSDRAAAALDARYLRRVGWSPGGTEWMFGVAVNGTVDGVRDRYAAYNSSDVFGYVAIGAGPAARTIWRVAGATVTNDLTVPLASFVDLPYSDGRMNGEALHLRPVSVAEWRAVADGVSLRFGRDGAPHVAWTYRVSYFTYELGQPRRYARQSLTAVLSVPVRSGPR